MLIDEMGRKWYLKEIYLAKFCEQYPKLTKNALANVAKYKFIALANDTKIQRKTKRIFALIQKHNNRFYFREDFAKVRYRGQNQRSDPSEAKGGFLRSVSGAEQNERSDGEADISCERSGAEQNVA